MDKVYPLSLLAFVASAHALLISRQPLPQRRNEESVPTSKSRGAELRGRTMGPQVAGLDHVFRRHVKPKKQHEIVNLTEVNVELQSGEKRIHLFLSPDSDASLNNVLITSTLPRLYYHHLCIKLYL